MTRLPFASDPAFEDPARLLRCPDAWPLYPVLPIHRDGAESAVMIALPGFPRHTIILVNMYDRRLGRMLRFIRLDDAPVDFITFASDAEIEADGWDLGEQPGWGLEHARDWDRRTEPCPACGGRGYRGLSSLAVPCRQCEASGTVMR